MSRAGSSYQRSHSALPSIDEETRDTPSIQKKNAILGGVMFGFVCLFAVSVAKDSTEHGINSSNSDRKEVLPRSNEPLLGTSEHKHKISSTQAEAGLQLAGFPSPQVQLEYERALEKIDWDAVETDIEDLMHSSQSWWPSDYNSYVGLFIRLSWHSCGSYRESDGRGGCDGGGQR